MRALWWRIALSLLLRLASLVLGLVTVLLLPLYGLFMVVWLHIPVASILMTVGPVMAVLGLAAYGMWRGGARVADTR
jgi:hypothetical protein